MRCSSGASCIVPMTASIGLPFLNRMKVGIDWTSYLVAIPELLVDVELPEVDTRAQLPGEALEHRFHGLAWATPDRPKVDQASVSGPLTSLVEVRLRQLNDVAVSGLGVL